MALSIARRTLGLACLLAVVAAPAPAALAADFYVSASLGDDAWSGTLPEPNASGTDGPKRSTAAAEQLLGSVAGPGDRVLFRMGDTWTGTAPALDVAATAATPAAPITVGAYGSGPLPRFDFVSGNYAAIVNVRPGAAHLVFESLHLTTSAPPGNRPYGVNVQGSNQVPVVHHLRFSGLIVEGLQYGFAVRSHQTVIENCVVRDNYKFPAAGEDGHSQGIWFGHSDDLVIRGSRIENNGKPDSHFDHNVYLSEGYRGIFEGNYVTGTDGLKLRKTKDTIVRGNTFDGLDLGAVSLGGDVDGGATNIVIERNVIEDTINGIVLTNQSTTGPLDPGIDGVIIRNNVFRSPRVTKTYWLGQKGYVMFANYKIRNVSIHGNLFYDLVNREGGVLRTAVYVQNSTLDPVNVSVKNNILHRSAPDAPLVVVERDSAFQSLALDYNLYDCDGCSLVSVGSTAYGSLAALRAQYPGLERSGAAGDPMFADPPADLHLSSASTLAIDRGASMPGLLDVDHDGRQRPQGSGVDIGPYEFVSGPPAAPLAPVLLPPE